MAVRQSSHERGGMPGMDICARTARSRAQTALEFRCDSGMKLSAAQLHVMEHVRATAVPTDSQVG